jgi:hypothetical protein
VANEKAIGPAIILQSCRYIASGLTNSLATSSNAAVAQHVDGGGPIFGLITASRKHHGKVSAG